MPHKDNAAWMSLRAGKPVTPPRRIEIQDLIDSRPFFDDMAEPADTSGLAEFHEAVVLRERGGEKLTVEISVPKGSGPFPMILHIHGGGFCVSTAKNDRQFCAQVAERGYVVVNVEYGRSPEHPFPWALEDCVYTARWIVEHGRTYRGDPGRLVIEGGSAGGNLTITTILALNGLWNGTLGQSLDEGDLAGVDVNVKAAVVEYGLLSFPLLLLETGSNVGSAELWCRAYLGPHFTTKLKNPLVSPVYATAFEGFPPTYLNCGDEDSFLSHTLDMTKVLAQASVPTSVSVVAGFDHGFLKLEFHFPTVRQEIDRMMAWVAEQVAVPTAAAV